MNLAIGKHFFGSLYKLNKTVHKKTVDTIEQFDEKVGSKGLNLEKLGHAASNNVFSIRVDRSVRVILAKISSGKYVALYVGQHEDAYRWAETHKISANETTNAFQIYETPTEESEVDIQPSDHEPQEPLFSLSDKQLRQLGTPEEWIPRIVALRSTQALDAIQHSPPGDVYEGLSFILAGESFDEVLDLIHFKPNLELLDTSKTEFNETENWGRDIILPDSMESLREMLEQPLDKWRVFLHPDQKEIARANFKGPARISGGPGTGKTVVALHRAKWLAKHQKKVWITAYDTYLTDDIKQITSSFFTAKEGKNVHIESISQWVEHQMFLHSREIKIRDYSLDNTIHAWKEIIQEHGYSDLDLDYIAEEFQEIILNKNIQDFKSYIKVSRKGRGRPLDGFMRQDLMALFDAFRARYASMNLIFREDAIHILVDKVENDQIKVPFTDIIVDEVQDLGEAELRLLSVISKKANFMEPQLFMVGDMNQRIKANTFPYSACGIKIVGRARRLHLNYRTSRNIYHFATEILTRHKPELEEDILKTASLFDSADPVSTQVENEDALHREIIKWLEKVTSATPNEEICILTRTVNQLSTIEKALNKSKVPTYVIRGSNIDRANFKGVRLSTLHRIKGLEFSAVAIVNVDDYSLPYKKSLDRLIDESSKKDFIDRELGALFVAMTRAKKDLFLSWHGKKSTLI